MSRYKFFLFTSLFVLLSIGFYSLSFSEKRKDNRSVANSDKFIPDHFIRDALIEAKELGLEPIHVINQKYDALSLENKEAINNKPHVLAGYIRYNIKEALINPSNENRVSEALQQGDIYGPSPIYTRGATVAKVDSIVFDVNHEELKKLVELGLDLSKVSAKAMDRHLLGLLPLKREAARKYLKDYYKNIQSHSSQSEAVKTGRVHPDELPTTESEQELIELHLDEKKLAELPPCLKSMSDMEAANFCQFVLDLFGEDRLREAEEGNPSFFKEISGQSCLVQSTVELQGTHVINGFKYKKKSKLNSRSNSFAALTPKIISTVGGQYLEKLDSVNKQIIPLFEFLQHSELFCESKIVENKFKEIPELLNMDLGKFLKVFKEININGQSTNVKVNGDSVK